MPEPIFFFFLKISCCSIFLYTLYIFFNEMFSAVKCLYGIIFRLYWLCIEILLKKNYVLREREREREKQGPSRARRPNHKKVSQAKAHERGQYTKRTYGTGWEPHLVLDEEWRHGTLGGARLLREFRGEQNNGNWDIHQPKMAWSS